MCKLKHTKGDNTGGKQFTYVSKMGHNTWLGPAKQFVSHYQMQRSRTQDFTQHLVPRQYITQS